MTDQARNVWCDVEVPQPLGAGLSQWACKKLTWRNHGIAYPNADFVKSMQYTKALVEVNCGMKLELVTESANIESFFVRIDGPQGVLARQYLPGYPSLCHEQRRGEWDNGEAGWLTQNYLDVITLHEFCHALGVGHYDAGDSVMNSRINIGMHGKVDNWLRDQLILRYDEATEEPEPGPSPEFDMKSFLRAIAQRVLELTQ